MSGNSEPDGAPCSGGEYLLTCPATCCSVFWLIGCKPISLATSMGRLTLNVLLSFAQFEREVTSERIHDKIAASLEWPEVLWPAR